MSNSTYDFQLAQDNKNYVFIYSSDKKIENYCFSLQTNIFIILGRYTVPKAIMNSEYHE